MQDIGNPATPPSPVATKRLTHTFTMRTQSRPVDPSTLRAILVDDERVNTRIGRNFLSRLGVPKANITCLSDGDELVAHLNDPDKPRPDVVFLDLLMPRMTGFEAAEQLQPLSQHCPFVVASGNIDVQPIATARALGFAGVLSKPFKAEQMGEALTRAVRGGPFFVVARG